MTPLLFHPRRVNRVLSVLPALKASLAAPATEGDAAAFAGWRKTTREIYRALANPHYRHLRETLRVIESVLAAGCNFDDLLSTSRHSQFSAHLSEAWAADHFLLRGFAVGKLPRTGSRGADLLVTKGPLTATIEVYSPRVWESLDDWALEIQDVLKNLDEPYDYALDLDVGVPHGLDPWTIARALDRTAQLVIDAATADLATALRAGNVGFRRTYQHGSSGLETRIELREMRPSSAGPARFLVLGQPALSGYAPEGMFHRLVHRNVIRRKAGKRQTQGATTRLRGMVVDLARTQIGNDLRHPTYRQKAEDILRPVNPSSVGLDFISFCGPNGLRRGLAVDFVVYEKMKLTESEVWELLERP